ncbi:hypothetical protein CTheo_1727 [Ceratobasidium theobromae]|uniref:Uncharacterized protein n=1 Tax=Ceratobasidium theobromae TaxID=1582974 RepID=A0A5N5QT27_9AGAM|nr:hypothetical protein CTheo_1727 [Ceratobasidium theobromae]
MGDSHYADLEPGGTRRERIPRIHGSIQIQGPFPQIGPHPSGRFPRVRFTSVQLDGDPRDLFLWSCAALSLTSPHTTSAFDSSEDHSPAPQLIIARAALG